MEEGFIFTKFSVSVPALCSYFHTLSMECCPIRGETITLHDLLTHATLNSLYFVAVSTDRLLLYEKVSLLDDLEAGGALEASLVENPSCGSVQSLLGCDVALMLD